MCSRDVFSQYLNLGRGGSMIDNVFACSSFNLCSTDKFLWVLGFIVLIYSTHSFSVFLYLKPSLKERGTYIQRGIFFSWLYVSLQQGWPTLHLQYGTGGGWGGNFQWISEWGLPRVSITHLGFFCHLVEGSSNSRWHPPTLIMALNAGEQVKLFTEKPSGNNLLTVSVTQLGCTLLPGIIATTPQI